MIGRVRWHFSHTDSTQLTAFRLATLGASHGTVVRANFQSSGRGRLGRTWEAPAGTSLMFSILLRPTQAMRELGLLSVRTAGVLGDVFAGLGLDDIALKWPNDVLIGGQKSSGILVQTRMTPEPVAVVGIGINISASPESATSLVQATGRSIDPDGVFHLVLAGFDRMWSAWQPELSVGEVESIERSLWLAGEPVSLLDADREIRGTVLGISTDGGLRLDVDGHERVIHVGEITRGPRLQQSRQVH